jgi:uncharacterized protein YebE (UPF0316 family)
MEFLSAYPWALVPAIFLARVLDVSLGTWRSIMTFRGHRVLAPTIGFLEVLIWLFAAGAVLQNLTQWYLTLAYAGGFAAGNYFGIRLESFMGIGSELVRVISFDPGRNLARRLRKAGYDPIELYGAAGERPAEVILVIEKRKRIERLLELVRREDPKAIYTISDVRSVYEGELPAPQSGEASGWRARGKRK